ncbi:glycine rich domain-containing protein, partial [Blautia wexlerae]|uniref:glycine rich domain-containing protein n=1 Tax=Blautia wexlerae TaxID=418240 RepID=UPI0019648B1A
CQSVVLLYSEVFSIFNIHAFYYTGSSSTAKNYPNGCLLNSTHYLTNAQTIAGNTSFTSPTGSAETGHTGSGFCRITNLNPTQYGLYVKTNSGWKHIDL